MDISPAHKHCFMARLNKYGEIIDSTYVKHIYAATQTYFYESECLAVAINYLEDEIVTVGYYQQLIPAVTLPSRKVLIVKSYLQNTPGVTNNDLFTQIRVRTFTAATDQVAYSVAMTADGTTYATGIINRYTRGSYDCFVTRLTSFLERVYFKTFGTTLNEQCLSIQVTRNNDYIYIGGQRVNGANTEIFFVKLTALADQYALNIKYIAYTQSLTLRRIILTQGKAFVGTSDENELYFCGSTPLNNGDFFFGKVDKTLSIVTVYNYGSTETEIGGDCSVTIDNEYLVGIFSTNYNNPRAPTVTLPIAQYIDSTFANYDLVSPFIQCQNIDINSSTNKGKGLGGGTSLKGDQDVDGQGGLVSCDVMDYNAVIQSLLPGGVIPTTGSDNYCIDTYQKSYTDFFAAEKDVFSWTSCQGAMIDFTNAACQREFSFYFSKCKLPYPSYTILNQASTTTTYQGFQETGTGAGLGNQIDIFQCEQAWSFLKIASTGPVLPNYSTGGSAFLQTMWDNLMASYPKEDWYPYVFCSKDNSSPPQKDKFNFIFEQDCYSDTVRVGNKVTQDWFIIKIKTSDMDGTVNSNIPNNAAYFGDRTGDETATSVFVDEFGYITVHGHSTSGVFGGSAANPSWLYGKTHWELQYELNVKVPYTPQFSYVNKRFIKPKKFRNSAGFTFLYLYTPASQGVTSFMSPRPVNRNLNGAPTQRFVVNGPWITIYYPENSWVTYDAITTTIFGVSQYALGNLNTEIRVQRGDQFSRSSPQFCSSTLDANGLRNFATDANTLVTGVTSVFAGPDDSALLILQGSPTAFEGLYYPYIWSYIDSMLGVNDKFLCPYVNFWNYQNNNLYPQQMRFQISQRVRFIVDDRYAKPPEVKRAITMLTLLIGQRYNTPVYYNTPSAVVSPFQHTCNIYYAMQSRYTDANGFTVKNLPIWSSFHEQNGTFTMYPDHVTGTNPYTFELYCCNSIKECALNIFQVAIIDKDPILNTTLMESTIYVQFDSIEQIGSGFTWNTDKYILNDPDVISDLTDTYSSQTHTVRVTKASVNTGMCAIQDVGAFFGQGFTTNIGLNTIIFSYEDRYSANKVYTGNQIKVIINRLPQLTAAGTAFKFSDIDPQVNIQKRIDSDFIEMLPQLNQRWTPESLSLKISDWFIDSDPTGSLSFEVSRSDSTSIPIWMDRDGDKIIGFPQPRMNEIIHIKIKCTDSSRGSIYFLRSFLVNSAPQIKRVYEVLEFGVNRKIAINLQDYFYDLDGDALQILLPRSKDTNLLQNYGLQFIKETSTITGRSDSVGKLALLQVQASDQYGKLSPYVYLTVKIVDLKPGRRLTFSMSDQYIEMGKSFFFALPDGLFLSKDSKTLIIFATNDLDKELPKWVFFEPAFRSFNGIAPLSLIQQKVYVRAFDQTTHDSASLTFLINVVRPKILQTNTTRIIIETVTRQNFRKILNRTLFPLYSNQQIPLWSIKIENANIKQPDWIKFNYLTREFSGIAQINPSKLNMTLILTYPVSNITQKVFFTLVISNLVSVPQNLKFLTILGVSISVFLSLFIYLSGLIHVAVAMKPNQAKINAYDRSVARFSEHQDIDLKFYMPEHDLTTNGRSFVQQESSVVILHNHK